MPRGWALGLWGPHGAHKPHLVLDGSLVCVRLPWWVEYLCGSDHTRLGFHNGADILILNDSNCLYQQEPGKEILFAQIPVTLGALLSHPDIKPSCCLLY